MIRIQNKAEVGGFTNGPAIKSSAEALKVKENNVEITGVAISFPSHKHLLMVQKSKPKNIEGEAMSGAPMHWYTYVWYHFRARAGRPAIFGLKCWIIWTKLPEGLN